MGVWIVIGVVAISALGWRIYAGRQSISGARANTSILSAQVAANGLSDVKGIDLTAAKPNPIFASIGSTPIRLPVQADNLTEIGFHQASYGYALHMATPLPDADTDAAKADKSTHRDLTKQETGSSAVLTGSVIRMWRNRPGRPDSAADVGAPAGTDLYAPVDGTVVKIKAYKLYDKYDDYEIHIQPTGQTDVDCVMIHVTDLTCAPGDEVEGGITRIAAVRKLSDRVNHQLSEYTTGGGDHTHVQFNNAEDPAYKGLEGAIAANPL